MVDLPWSRPGYEDGWVWNGRNSLYRYHAGRLMAVIDLQARTLTLAQQARGLAPALERLEPLARQMGRGAIPQAQHEASCCEEEAEVQHRRWLKRLQ